MDELKISQNEPFTFLGVEDLLLPGTDKEPCPWFSSHCPAQVAACFVAWSKFHKYGHEVLAAKAAIAAMWWNTRLWGDSEETLICNQYEHWAEVFDRVMQDVKVREKEHEQPEDLDDKPELGEPL